MKVIIEFLERTDLERINELKNGDTYIIDVEVDEIRPYFVKYGVELKDIIHQCLWNILQKKYQGEFIEDKYNDLKIKVEEKARIKLQDINPDFEGIPTTFDAVIIAVDARKAFIESAVVECEMCGDAERVHCDVDRKLRYIKCLTPKCKGRSMKINATGMVTKYVQTVIIQEPLEEADNNSPVSFIGKLIDEDVGEAFVGQKKRITGVFRTKVNPKKEDFDINIDVIDMEDLGDDEKILPDDALVLKIDSGKDREEFFEEVSKSYAPHIYGNVNIKKTIMLLMAGGIQGGKRGDINMLLIGDPSMGKSELLKFGNKVTQKSMYTNGKGSTGAGLTISMRKDERIGSWIASSGVYPLCNGGYVFVDEFDKMNSDDRSAMHEVLEQGTCSVAKAGIKMTLDAKASTLAAANPKFGHYDSDLTLIENVNLPSPLISRFDLIWLIKDKITNVEDNFKAKYILSSFEEGGDKSKPYFNEKELLAYINHVRKVTPVLTTDASEKIKQLWIKMREIFKQKKDDSIPVGVRQLEALIRLSMAHAKLLLKTKVDVGDVTVVSDLFKASYKSFGIDLDTGEVRTAGLFGTDKLSKEQQFKKTWHEVSDDNQRVRTEDLIKALADKEGWDEGRARRLWEAYQNKGNIMMSDDGRWRWEE